MNARYSAAIASVCLWLTSGSGHADLSALQSAWADAMYQTAAGEARQRAMATLADTATAETSAHPDDPALLIWQGIILSSYAGEKGGLGALGIAKRARASLERSLELDPEALQGSAHTSLGTLYYKVPGWPIGFGNRKEARKQLQAALEINPRGIDPNYFMGEFLFEEGEYQAAREHLATALQAPDRPGRSVADNGRREEIRRLLGEVDDELD